MEKKLKHSQQDLESSVFFIYAADVNEIKLQLDNKFHAIA